MTTATAEKPRTRRKAKGLDVEFQGVSVGDKTARVGVKLDRSAIDLQATDELLADSRLEVTITLAEDEDQPSFAGMEPPRLESVADVKGYRVDAGHIGFGLTFALGEIEVQTLAQFAKKAGRLIAKRIGAASEVEDGDDDTGATEE